MDSYLHPYMPTKKEIEMSSLTDPNQSGLTMCVSNFMQKYPHHTAVAFGTCSALYKDKKENFLKVIAPVYENGLNGRLVEYHIRYLFSTKAIIDTFMTDVPKPSQFPAYICFKTLEGKKFIKMLSMPMVDDQKPIWKRLLLQNMKKVVKPDSLGKVCFVRLFVL